MIRAKHKSRKPVAEVPQTFRQLQHEVNKVKLDISLSRDGVERQRNLLVSNGYLKQNLQHFGR